MKKLFHIGLLCLCALSAYSQKVHHDKTRGTYIFQKAILTVYNANSRSVIDTRTINDLSTLSNEKDVFFGSVFREANINDGQLTSCMLSDSINYIVKDLNELIPAPIEASAKKSDQSIPKPNYPVQLTPYSFSIEGNTLTFTTGFLYGNSQYSFPLEGKLVLTMTKQK